MAIADKIQQTVQKLPAALQAEILDYAEYLAEKWARDTGDESQISEASLSLALAMRGMEDEEGPEYGLDDLKVLF
ncbi:MAG: DUF2281 domain-containing protein [Anaerolineae bacterium]